MILFMKVKKKDKTNLSWQNSEYWLPLGKKVDRWQGRDSKGSFEVKEIFYIVCACLRKNLLSCILKYMLYHYTSIN